MSTAIDTFTADVHGALVQTFQKLGGKSDSQTLLAFLPLGTPISPVQFKLNPADATWNSNVALEQCSEWANALPRISNGVYVEPLAHLQEEYELLFSAAPASEADTDVFATVKAQAMEAFKPDLGSMDPNNTVRYHPAFATPKDWFDASNADNWSTYQFSWKENTAETTTVGTPPVPVRPLPPRTWGWQVVAQRAAVPAPQPPHPMPQRLPMMMARPMMARPMVARSMMMATAFRPAEAVPFQATVIQQRQVQMAVQAQQARALANSAQTQQVVSKTFSVSFRYCLVQLDRPWFADTFLGNRRWYIPGYKSGSLASGAFDDTSSAPADAPLSALPIAFVAVKDLHISGDWDAADQAAITHSAGLGPFSLTERSSTSTATDITCNGVQIVAWFCRALPALPPLDDPALAAPAPNPTPVTAAAATSGGGT